MGHRTEPAAVEPLPISKRDRAIVVLLAIVISVAVLRPLIVYLTVMRADQLFMSGKTREAARAYRKAVILDPRNARLHSDVAFAYQRMGTYDSAVQEFAAAVRLEPLKASHHFNLGLVLVKEREYEAASKHLKQAVALKPKDRLAYAALAAAYRRGGLIDEAIGVLKTMRSRFPDILDIDGQIETLETSRGG